MNPVGLAVIMAVSFAVGYYSRRLFGERWAVLGVLIPPAAMLAVLLTS